MKGQVIAELHIVPLGTSSTSLSRYVSAGMEVLKSAKDIRYQLTPMCTVVEGQLERVLELVRKMHEVPFAMGAQRVYTILTIDDRRDKAQTMENKVKAVG